MTLPKIKTMLPGSKARKLIKQDQTYVSPSYTRYYPLVVEKAKGLYTRMKRIWIPTERLPTISIQNMKNTP